jgi:hypothetical protein
MPGDSGSFATTGCWSVTPRWPATSTLDGQLFGMPFCIRLYNVDYVNTRKDKHRGKHRPILNDNPGGDLAGASRLDR